MEVSQSEYLRTSLSDSVLEIVFARPEKKNALTRQMYEALARAIESAEMDPNVRVVLLCGEGDAFTGGNDLMDFMQDPPTSEDSPVFRALMAISSMQKPLLAAVHGPAIGIGTTLLLHCDLVYAAPSAIFRTPFVDLGLCPEAASSLLLPARIGLARAAALLLLGDTYSGEQAYEAGLITELVPEDALLEVARAKASILAGKPPAAVRLTKRLMRASTEAAVRNTIRAEGKHFVERLGSPEASEAFRAFFERRTPDFSGFD